MKKILRTILSVITFVSVFFFTKLVVIATLNILPFNTLLSQLIALVLAFISAVFIWKKTVQIQDNFAKYCLTGGIIIGSIGFLGGFIGPMIFRPDANLGPLLGIFFTGPIGFLMGLLGGWIYWILRIKKTKST